MKVDTTKEVGKGEAKRREKPGRGQVRANRTLSGGQVKRPLSGGQGKRTLLRRQNRNPVLGSQVRPRIVPRRSAVSLKSTLSMHRMEELRSQRIQVSKPQIPTKRKREKRGQIIN